MEKDGLTKWVDKVKVQVAYTKKDISNHGKRKWERLSKARYSEDRNQKQRAEWKEMEMASQPVHSVTLQVKKN